MLGARVVKDFVVQRIESIIDEEKSVKHSKLMEMTEQVILEPAKVKDFARAGHCHASVRASVCAYLLACVFGQWFCCAFP